MAKAGKHTASSSSFVVPLLYLMITVLLYSGCKSVDARDTLLPGQSLSGNQSLLSKYGSFKLGFDSDCTFGIWYMNSSTCSPLLVWAPDGVWLECIDKPSFGLSKDGSLYLQDDEDSVPWSSPGTAISAVAILLDNGNLVVRDKVNISLVSWQSFDNPLGALLPGGWLGFNRITGKNVSLIWNYHFILKINAEQSRGFTMQDTSDNVNYSGAFPSWMDIHEEDGGPFLMFNDAHLYLQLHDDGTVSAAKLGDCGPALWSPYSRCGYPAAYCGPDSICVVAYAEIRSYCLRVAAPHCLSNLSAKQDISFQPIDEILVFPETPSLVQVRDIRECETICSSDCSCTSYAFNATCLLWSVELHKLTVGILPGSHGHLYVRTAKQKENSSSKIEIIIPTVTGILLLLLVALLLSWRSKRKLLIERPENCSSGLTVFSDAQMKKVTRNFSAKLGEGGFGCVFKGTLLPAAGSSMVAVKALKDLGHGEKQFRAEVQTIGMRMLVRGCWYTSTWRTDL